GYLSRLGDLGCRARVGSRCAGRLPRCIHVFGAAERRPWRPSGGAAKRRRAVRFGGFHRDRTAAVRAAAGRCRDPGQYRLRDGRVTPLLYVQGADIDVGAVVTIGGVDVPTAAHRALRNDLYGMDPNALGYPIYHYVSLLAAPGTQAPGSTIMVAVRNLGGQTS